MKKILGLVMVLCIIAAFAVCAHAESSGTCGDNLTWVLSDDGTLTISGTGDMYDYKYKYGQTQSSSTAPWSEIQYNIKKVIIEDGVTSIGAYAFVDHRVLTSISIPRSVTKLSDNFYYYNTRVKVSPLEEINVASGNNVYTSIDGILYNKDLTTVIQCPRANKVSVYTVPNSLKTIEKNAFCMQQNLTKVIINDGATEIGNNAFCECYNLKEVQLSETIQKFEYAFYACKNLETVYIPYGITEISNNAFQICYSLVNVGLPNSIQQIGEHAFDACTSLTDVYFYGNESEWSAIEVLSGNAPLLNANIHFGGATSTPTPTPTARPIVTPTSRPTATPKPTTTPEPTPTLEPIDDYSVSIDKAEVVNEVPGIYNVNMTFLNNIPSFGQVQVIAAAYNDGKLLDYNSRLIFNDSDSLQMPVIIWDESIADCIKVFIWKDLVELDMRPLCEPVTIYENDFVTE